MGSGGSVKDGKIEIQMSYIEGVKISALNLSTHAERAPTH